MTKFPIHWVCSLTANSKKIAFLTQRDENDRTHVSGRMFKFRIVDCVDCSLPILTPKQFDKLYSDL